LGSVDSARTQLEEKLRVLEERLRNELRARGFDPAQAENIALPGPLAKLYLEKENVRAELEALTDSEEANG
jgi:hypothetical protein